MTTADTHRGNFASNLRLLCQSEASIADVCRRIGVSRQQFNKYLSGQHLPSQYNLDIIARHFLVDPSDLHLPAQVFHRRIGNSPTTLLRAMGQLRRFADFAQILHDSTESSGALVGIYERYQLSAIYEGRILRSICKIERKGELLCHGYVERFPDPDHPGRVATTFHYRGLVLAIGGRIAMVDFETVQRNEVTATILAPRLRSSAPLFFGVTMGVAANIGREPFATRVAMRRIAVGPLTATHLRRALTLHPRDKQIPSDISQYLTNENRVLRAIDLATNTKF